MKRLLIIKRHHGEHHHAKHHDSYERTSDAVEDRMENPPHTWAAYAAKPHGLFDIIEMEHRELQAMRETGTHKQIVKELVDLSAAAAMAAHKMTCPGDMDDD